MRKIENWEGLLENASSDVRRLDYITRYSSIPVSIPESVSAHSFWVALYSIMIHKHMDGPKELDAMVMLHGLTHDLPECLMGDIVRTAKYSSEEFRSAVNKAEKNLSESLPSEIKSILKEVDEFTSNTQSWEGSYVEDVVKAADFMSLHQYMWREKKRGNTEIDQFFNRMVKDLRVYAEKYRTKSVDFPDSLTVNNNLYHLYSSMSEGFCQKFTV